MASVFMSNALMHNNGPTKGLFGPQMATGGSMFYSYTQNAAPGGGNGYVDYEFSGSSTYLLLCSGNVPTQVPSNLGWSNLSGSTQCLLYCATPDITTEYMFTRGEGYYTLNLGRQSTPQAAQYPGTATHFYIISTKNSTWSAGNFNVHPTVLGTVGVTGSGADLEVKSTSIVNGSLYTFNGVRVRIPQLYTW